jgi:hypothetical protein
VNDSPNIHLSWFGVGVFVLFFLFLFLFLRSVMNCVRTVQATAQAQVQ